VRNQHRTFAFAKIISGRLSGDLRIPENAQKIVAELESPTER